MNAEAPVDVRAVIIDSFEVLALHLTEHWQHRAARRVPVAMRGRAPGRTVAAQAAADQLWVLKDLGSSSADAGATADAHADEDEDEEVEYE
jgi:hypothetical protein